MGELGDKLVGLADQLDAVVKEQASKAISEPLRKVREAANEIGRSWSGSFLGYQSRVYYDDLQATPPGAHFSVEWGLEDLGRGLGLDMGTKGHWAEYTFEEIRAAVFSKAGTASLDGAKKLRGRAKEVFANSREEFLSVVSIMLENASDTFLASLKDEAEGLKILGQTDYVKAMLPKGQIMSRDAIAMGQGFQTPPHLAVLAEVLALENVPKRCGELGRILRRAASHFESRQKHQKEKRTIGYKGFFRPWPISCLEGLKRLRSRSPWIAMG